MKKILFVGLILLAVNALYVSSASAETRVLVVPAHHWSDGEYRPTLKWAFFDAPYNPYNAHAQCMYMARQIHKGKVSPAFSACTTEFESRKFR